MSAQRCSPNADTQPRCIDLTMKQDQMICLYRPTPNLHPTILTEPIASQNKRRKCQIRRHSHGWFGTVLAAFVWVWTALPAPGTDSLTAPKLRSEPASPATHSIDLHRSRVTQHTQQCPIHFACFPRPSCSVGHCLWSIAPIWPILLATSLIEDFDAKFMGIRARLLHLLQGNKDLCFILDEDLAFVRGDVHIIPAQYVLSGTLGS